MLNLHSGGELITLDDLRTVPVPERTRTHVPLPHIELVDMVKYALGFYGHEVIEEHHAIHGERYFGLMTLKSEYGDYTDTVGLRNSHDRTFPIGIALGSCVFVCSNLSFMGDHVIRRKHTANSKRDLPGLVSEIVEPLKAERLQQHQKLLTYKETELTDAVADQTVIQMYRRGVINLQRIPDVLHEWDEPSHDWGEKSAWRLFNAATFALTGKVAENPASTRQLHDIIDGVCITA